MRCKGLNSWTSWIQSAAASVVYFLLIPVYRLGGLFYVAVIDYYGVERDEAAIPFVVLTLARCLGGITFGVLAQRFGVRKIALIGCFLAAIGVFASAFARSILALSFTLGLYGLGLTSSALLACIIRGHFDDNAITISNAVLNIGPCMTVIIFPSIFIYLFDSYGLPSTLMLTTGFILNTIPFLMILKEYKNKKASCKSTTDTTNKIEDSSTLIESGSLKATKVQNESSSEALNTESKILPKNTNIFDKENQFISHEKTDSVIITSSIIEMKVSTCLEHNKQKCHCISDFMAKNNHQIYPTLISDDTKNSSVNSDSLTKKSYSNKAYQLLNENEQLNLNENTESINEQNISKLLTDNSDDKIQPPMIMEPTQKDSSVVSVKRSNNKNKNDKRNAFQNFLNAMTDITFITLWIVQGLFAYTYNILLTTIVDYSRDKGIDQSKEVYILTLSSVGDIIGRLAFTWVTDKNYLTYSSFGTILYVMMGISCTWIALSNDFIMYIVAIMMLTMVLGIMLNIYPGMTYAYIEKEKHILSISSIAVLYAPMSFTVSPLIGYFRGRLGSYDGLYYLLTVTNLVASLLVLLLPRFSKARKKEKVKKIAS